MQPSILGRKEILMKIYLVEHARAKPKEEDPERHITEEGRADTVKVAGLAELMGLEISKILHSGKTRAKETAETIAYALRPPGGIEVIEGLNPMDDVKLIAQEIVDSQETLMLVGHLPFMQRLASYLVAGNPDEPIIKFQYSTIVCLTHDEEHWWVDWVLKPEMAGK
jgi:phosphohistidine phosphatase